MDFAVRQLISLKEIPSNLLELEATAINQNQLENHGGNRQKWFHFTNSQHVINGGMNNICD